eukprot:COSAG03_NODE_21240_length_307_cov_0.701923_1_plen_23_part_10
MAVLKILAAARRTARIRALSPFS